MLALFIIIDNSKTSNAFSPLCIFELKVVFRYHFLGHFLAELNEICCGSLLNIILKTYRRKILWFWFFYLTKSEILLNFVFSHKKMIKHVLCNKSKNASVRFFIYMSSVCATFHCIWRSGFKVICTLVSTLKSKMSTISMETKRGKKIILFFFTIFFILIIINVQWKEWVEKWGKQFFDQHLPTLNGHCCFPSRQHGLQYARLQCVSLITSSIWQHCWSSGQPARRENYQSAWSSSNLKSPLRILSAQYRRVEELMQRLRWG